MTSRALAGGIYNCHEGRDRREFRAAMARLLDDHRPAFLLLQETVGYIAVLATLAGYRLAAHDRCGTSLLVREDIEVKWANTYRLGFLPWLFKTPARKHLRLHPRRALCYGILDDWLDAASIHCVPAPDSPLRRPIYITGMKRLAKWANDRPRRALLIAGDWNKSAHRPGVYTPSWLAEQISLKNSPAHTWPVEGHPIDFPVTRRCTVTDLRVAGAYGSDHELVLFTVNRLEAA